MNKLAQILPYFKEPYHSQHPYLLSHSILDILHTCERKFQLERMLVYNKLVNEDRAPLIRGTAYGAGVQAYILTGDMDLAILICWLYYWPITETTYITCSRTINNLLQSKEKLDYIRKRYEVAVFNGEPAIELSFRLNVGEKWYHIGFIDLILFDKEQGIYVVFEIKTTAYKLHDLSAVYKNSGQALGYSIVLDKIAGEKQSKYGVVYLVCRDKGLDPVPEVYIYPFNKSLGDRLNWFISLGMDVQRLDQMEEFGVFPMRGQSCVKFNRVCTHFGTCSLTASDVKKENIKDNMNYSFVYDLNDIISDHLERVK